MKLVVYLRVAKTPRSRGKEAKIAASLKLDRRPLVNSTGRILPTTTFALALDIPDGAFTSAARVVAELRVPEEKLEIAAEVLEIDQEEERDD